MCLPLVAALHLSPCRTKKALPKGHTRRRHTRSAVATFLWHSRSTGSEFRDGDGLLHDVGGALGRRNEGGELSERFAWEAVVGRFGGLVVFRSECFWG